LNGTMGHGARSDLRQPRADDAIKRLGRYQIIGRLATGGMAEVYLALSGDIPGFRTLAVVKRILPHLSSNSQFIRMFLDEARIASLLDHPNVVRIVEVGHDGDDYFLAMELVQGKPLSAVLRKAARERKPPSPALGAYVVAQAASGLAYAHGLTDGDGRSMGVVHRDVSPQNVLISFEGAIKMIDFGVARAYGRVAHTSPGGLKGKIDYMSPEQASAEEVDHRADVFALGIVLWEILTGKRLFRRDTELATMRAIVDDPIPKPSDVAASVPPELEAIVMRALRKRRDARFATAGEMADALERYALSHDGFSPSQVAGYMKGLFRTEFLQWRKTATAALDMEVEEEPTDRQRAAQDPQASGVEPATMALRPGMSWSRGGTDVRSATHGPREGSVSRARARSQAPAVAPVAASGPSRRDRIWVYGGLAVLAAVGGAGLYLLARPPSPVWQKLSALRRGSEAVAQPLPPAPRPPLPTETYAAPAGIITTPLPAAAPTPPPPAPAAPAGETTATAPNAGRASETRGNAWTSAAKPAAHPTKTRPKRRASAARSDAAATSGAAAASATRPTEAEKPPEPRGEKRSEKADPFE
jgi:serine/threonine protein kinase